MVDLLLNSSHSEQNGRIFAGDIFKCISMDEKYYIFIQMSLKFIFPEGSN